VTSVRSIHVTLPSDESYEIRVGRGALADFGDKAREVKPCEKAVVISDENVGPAYGKLVVKRLEEAGYDVFDLLVTPGEESKSLEMAKDLWISLAQYDMTRGDLVVAVGGGVVGDLAGFVASTYMRGIDFIQVPTSLLAMVDASIGGKTAVDLPIGKNLVGTFHQPLYVCSDTRCLKTLHDEDWANGFAEIAKSAMVAPRRSFYEWLRNNAEDLVAHDESALDEVVYMTAEFKANVVARDAHEANLRECLNYGHTLAHAIEAAAGYGTIGHGRAVAEGMRFAARLAVEVRGLSPDVVKKQDALLDALGLEQLPWTARPEDLFRIMKNDKKVRNGHLRFVLLDDIAKWECVTVPDETVIAHLEAWCAAKQKLIEKAGYVYGQGE
jgi:3-dehydroquinate synthase